MLGFFIKRTNRSILLFRVRIVWIWQYSYKSEMNKKRRKTTTAIFSICQIHSYLLGTSDDLLTKSKFYRQWFFWVFSSRLEEVQHTIKWILPPFGTVSVRTNNTPVCKGPKKDSLGIKIHNMMCNKTAMITYFSTVESFVHPPCWQCIGVTPV